MSKINWEHPNLQQMTPEKLNLLKNIAQELDNMTSDTAIAYILTLNSKLKEQNITFTNEEFNCLLSSISYIK